MDGVNVIGFVSANFGLGVAARSTVRLLSAADVPVAVVDLPLSGGRSGQNRSFDHLMIKDNTWLPYEVTIFHVNPPRLGRLLAQPPEPYDLAAGLTACVPFWEQTMLPDAWIADLRKVDLVLAPSHFIEKAMTAGLGGPPPLVRHYPQTVFLPQGHRPDRVRFGLPEHSVLFCMSFEMTDDIERKNPWAVIEGFAAAFPPGDDVRLVVKINKTDITPASQQQARRLRDRTAENRHIIIFDKNLSYTDIISLYESCDVYVSLHRSEGLGLGPMEAMTLGKPVIATGWSGTVDFMNDTNSCLVGHRLIPVNSPLYNILLAGKNAAWAEPDTSEAAAWMRRLYDDPGLRVRIGTAAGESMQSWHRDCLAKNIAAVLREVYRRKKERISQGSQTVPASDLPQTQEALFSALTGFLRRNDIRSAMELYEKRRPAFSDTPELVRLDTLMRQLREKAADRPR